MNKNRMYPTWFIFGALLLYVVLYVLPSVMGIAYSFTDWSVYSQEVHYVGLKNFQTVFSADYNYNRMLGNTFLFTIVTTLAKNVIGLALAVLLTKKVRLLNFHRAVMYLPCVLSALIVGMIFKSVLNPKIGLLNTALRAVGLDPNGRYTVKARHQNLRVGDFGALVHYVAPVKLNPRGFLMSTADGRYEISDCKEKQEAGGGAIMSGIRLNNRFNGTGYNENTRMQSDFGSAIYQVERVTVPGLPEAASTEDAGEDVR